MYSVKEECKASNARFASMFKHDILILSTNGHAMLYFQNFLQVGIYGEHLENTNHFVSHDYFA